MNQIDARMAKGLALLFSGRPQAAIAVLDRAQSLGGNGLDHARHLRCLVWVYMAHDEAYVLALDGSVVMDVSMLRARFGWPEDSLNLILSRQAKIDEVKRMSNDKVPLEESRLLDFIKFYAMAKGFAFSLCPANIVVPQLEQAYISRASHLIHRARYPPPLVRGDSFAVRQHIRLCSMCVPQGIILSNMGTSLPLIATKSVPWPCYSNVILFSVAMEQL
eukprot:TRINITY_DN64017_c0_g1_i1.p1 TRINITY_DN64017_c0_g1~~TRINITY_DN64017_c0_g1_i1.p1  ORF type:complete len:219 (-),score=13.11 TRINITY_DN64017_c0_g1_i1:500-1156(-)